MTEVEGQGFTIKDKRASKQTEEEAKAADASQEKKADPKQEPEAPPQDFELNFSTFVLSLTSSAFYHLGDIPDPVTGQKQENLPAVKQTIDILLILKEKTKNNLDADEAKLLEQLIYELQLKYVAKTRK